MASQETLDKQCILVKLRRSSILSIKAHGGGGISTMWASSFLLLSRFNFHMSGGSQRNWKAKEQKNASADFHIPYWPNSSESRAVS
jgi:hypothetical protein